MSETRYYPEHDASVVVLVNANGSVDPSGLADAIGDHLFGTPERATTPYPGDLAALVGAYEGPVRGDNDAAARVDLNAEGHLVLTGLGPTRTLEHLEGTTFAAGTGRYVFTLEDGVPVRLDADQIYGHYVLAAGTLGPVEVVEVAPEVMARHVGRYEVADMNSVAEVTLDDDGLWVQLQGQARLHLVADGDDDYHLVEAPVTFAFEVVEGRTVAVTVTQGPTVVRAARIEGDS